MAPQTPFTSNGMTYKVAGTLVGTYTIQANDSFSAVADRFGFDLKAVLAANPGVDPGNLQVGQVINLPTKATGLVFNLGDVSRVLGVSVQDLQLANPGISNRLSINEIIQAPIPSGGQPSSDIPGGVGGGPGGGDRVTYSGPASNFPDYSQWASYAALWDWNFKLMKFNDSDAEIAMVKTAIETVARESGVDVRVILCVIMQESGGNVRAGGTPQPGSGGNIQNPGYMQSAQGVSFNPNDPAGSILQMTRDGAEGTKFGDGLKQGFQQWGNWYSALRAYNSGSVDERDLGNGFKATASYVTDVANRLMGHRWEGM